ncbi:hypothetical protein PA25_34750 [Pseudoalteromonas sp. A25]|nr:hypothetical protein PA25_34750 [Pseudoalteromonas sp. A25]
MFKQYLSSTLFESCIKKITLNKSLSSNEAEYLYSVAIVFLNVYEKDKRKRTYFDFSYYIILLVSISIKDYRALHHFSLSFGLYPISSHIKRFKLIDDDSLEEVLIGEQIECYKSDGIVDTHEQNTARDLILEKQAADLAFIAPTSFGKSSTIVSLIKKNNKKRFAVIVPTKSLLAQTFRKLNAELPDRNLYFHDEMFVNCNDFVAVLTQERALRALKKQGVSFDFLIVDEAHKIFDFNSRSILLSRLIKRNKRLNPSSNTIYLSPLISDPNNLAIDIGQRFEEARIEKNVKEVRAKLHDEDHKNYVFNRYVQKFFYESDSIDYMSYILENKKEKNFVFLRTPRKIESFAKEIAANLPDKNNAYLNEIAEIVSRYIHEEHFSVEYIKKGLVYIHGQMPDILKEYLEYKFGVEARVSFLIANSVVLEGVNLPIDNLYMLDLRGVNDSDLINLVGRVNRLNEVFSEKDKNLDKLVAEAHFVHAGNYTTCSMKNKVEQLKSRLKKDEVKNPLLLNHDMKKIESLAEKSNEEGENAKLKLVRLNQVLENENYLDLNYLDDSDIAVHLIENGVSSHYSNQGSVLDILRSRALEFRGTESWHNLDVLDKVYHFFIKGLDAYLTKWFVRLSHFRFENTREYYRAFIRNLHQLTLKEHLQKQIRYQYQIKSTEKGRLFFIGESFGEISKDEGNKLYVDLTDKSRKEMVNLALIKIKLEGDLVAYKINILVEVLYRSKLLTDSEYNLFIYGTNNVVLNSFSKLGISSRLLRKLEADGQFRNIKIDNNGHIDINDEFRDYLLKQDDFAKFEMLKYLNV